MSISTIILMGLLALSAFVLMRIFRGGLGSFDETMNGMRKRIKNTEAQVREQTLSIGREEQMRIMNAAVRELLDSPACLAGAAIAESNEKVLRIDCPQGEINIAFLPKIAHLASQGGRALHGRGRWRICSRHGAEENEENFESLDLAVRHVRDLLYGVSADSSKI